MRLSIHSLMKTPDAIKFHHIRKLACGCTHFFIVLAISYIALATNAQAQNLDKTLPEKTATSIQENEKIKEQENLKAILEDGLEQNVPNSKEEGDLNKNQDQNQPVMMQSQTQPHIYHLAAVKHQRTPLSNQAFTYQNQNTTISEQRQTGDPDRVINVKTAGLNYSFNRDRSYHDSAQKNARVMQVNIFKYK